MRFDPQTGCIDAVADLDVLWEVMTPDERASTNSGENVLNGIAYDAKTGLFYLTGKRWRAIFVGRFRAQVLQTVPRENSVRTAAACGRPAAARASRGRRRSAAAP